MAQRIQELDTWRGTAVLLMIIYHSCFAMNFLQIAFVDLQSWFWTFLATFVRLSFLILVGVSLKISAQSSFPRKWRKKQFKRGLMILLSALFISLITYWYTPENFIRFGILHLIAVSVFVLIPFVNNKKALWILTGGSFTTWAFIPYLPFDSWMSIIIGTPGFQFETIDWFPIVPWLGWVSLGALFSAQFISIAREIIPTQSSLLQTLGRNSLLIYLVHVPIIIATLELMRFVIR